MNRSLGLCAVALVSCVTTRGDAPRPGGANAAASDSAAMAGDQGKQDGGAGAVAALTDAAPRTPVPEGPPKWKTVPREQNGFYAVLDGLCSKLAAARVGKDVVVHYGGTSMYTSERSGTASFIALRDDGLESIGDPVIQSPTGTAGASLDDFWIADSTGSRSSEGAVLHRYTAGTWKKYQKDQTHIHAWVDGGTIGTLGFAAANGDVWVEGSTTKPPDSFHANMHYPALSAFPTGDVVIVAPKTKDGEGFGGDGPLVARHWAPGKKVIERPLDKVLPATGDNDWASLYEVSPDEIYALRSQRSARWDGTSWQPLAKTADGQKISFARRAAPNELWVVTEGSKLQRITKDAATTIAIPEPVADMDGIDRGAAWIVGTSGKLYRREGEAWKVVSLPMPVFSAGANFKAKRVIVIAPDDVLVTGMYWEKGPGWKEQELHHAIFRSKPVKETLRCNEPDPENNNAAMGRGFKSWPPMADAACKSPFTVLARRSNTNKRNDDWPTIRAALKGHPELGEVSLVDFVSGDRLFVGAKAKDLDTAKKLAQLTVQKDRLRPEVVCGEPSDVKRTLAVDLTTGAATPK